MRMAKLIYVNKDSPKRRKGEYYEFSLGAPAAGSCRRVAQD